MRIKIYFILLFILPAFLFAQADKESRKVQLADGSFVIPDNYPELVKPVKPVYPNDAILQDIQGKVYVKVTINESGKVESARIAQGISPSLNKAALTAAKKMEFKPAVLKGKNVKVSIAVPVNFILDPNKKGPEIETNKNIIAGQALKEKEGDQNIEPDPSVFIPVEKQPERLKIVKPVYPELAKRANITGRVILKVLVSKEGKPIKTLLLKADNEIFIEPSKEAAMKTLFSPAIQNRKPIMCWVNIPYVFSLGEEDKRDKSIISMILLDDVSFSKASDISLKYLEGRVSLQCFFTVEAALSSWEYLAKTNTELDKKALEIVRRSIPENINDGIKKNQAGKEVFCFEYNLNFVCSKSDKNFVTKYDPTYPEGAKKDKLQGTVEIELAFNMDGSLRYKKIAKGCNSILDAAALNIAENDRILPKSIQRVPDGQEDKFFFYIIKVIDFIYPEE